MADSFFFTPFLCMSVTLTHITVMFFLCAEWIGKESHQADVHMGLTLKKIKDSKRSHCKAVFFIVCLEEKMFSRDISTINCLFITVQWITNKEFQVLLSLGSIYTIVFFTHISFLCINTIHHQHSKSLRCHHLYRLQSHQTKRQCNPAAKFNWVSSQLFGWIVLIAVSRSVLHTTQALHTVYHEDKIEISLFNCEQYQVIFQCVTFVTIT